MCIVCMHGSCWGWVAYSCGNSHNTKKAVANAYVSNRRKQHKRGTLQASYIDLIRTAHRIVMRASNILQMSIGTQHYTHKSVKLVQLWQSFLSVAQPERAGSGLSASDARVYTVCRWQTSSFVMCRSVLTIAVPAVLVFT